MTLLEAADMLADVLGIEDVYAGCIDANKDKCIGVYASKNTYPKKISIGGKPFTKTLEKHISVLIHWTDNPTTAESAANEILDKLTDVHGYTAGGHTVGFLSCSEAHNAGRDERGICEYVIDVTVYYERSN